MWLEWIVAWFIRIPNLDHKSKVTLLMILKDPDWETNIKIKYLVEQVKKLVNSN
jgi:hypothetical protein